MKRRLLVYALSLCVVSLAISSCKFQEKKIEHHIKAFRNEDMSIRSHSITELAQIGEPAVPALIEALNDENVWVRTSSALTLSNIGTPAKAAVPALGKRLNDIDENDEVRQSALKALKAIGTAETIMAIAQYKFSKPD